MSEEVKESTSERGLLTDIFIFLVLVGLGLAAVYFTGNWPWFMKMVANLEAEIQSFIKMFSENVKTVADVAQTASSL